MWGFFLALTPLITKFRERWGLRSPSSISEGSSMVMAPIVSAAKPSLVPPERSQFPVPQNVAPVQKVDLQETRAIEAFKASGSSIGFSSSKGTSEVVKYVATLINKLDSTASIPESGLFSLKLSRYLQQRPIQEGGSPSGKITPSVIEKLETAANRLPSRPLSPGTNSEEKAPRSTPAVRSQDIVQQVTQEPLFNLFKEARGTFNNLTHQCYKSIDALHQMVGLSLDSQGRPTSKAFGTNARILRDGNEVVLNGKQIASSGPNSPEVTKNRRDFIAALKDKPPGTVVWLTDNKELTPLTTDPQSMSLGNHWALFLGAYPDEQGKTVLAFSDNRGNPQGKPPVLLVREEPRQGEGTPDFQGQFPYVKGIFIPSEGIQERVAARAAQRVP
jgi:hypothetical protein